VKVKIEDSIYGFINSDINTKEHSVVTSGIPKRIHQIWIGNNKPPYKWIDSFRNKFLTSHPNWEYHLWTENEIKDLKLINNDLYKNEESLVAKSDILRYEILYQFGGIYFDADILWLNNKSLNDLLTDTNQSGIFVGREDHRLLGSSVIGSSQKNKILKEVIDQLRINYKTLRVDNSFPPWIATGPVLFSEILKNYKIKILPTYYFYPLSWHYDQTKADPNDYPESYTIHYGYSTNNLEVYFE
jgi:mannosyltransferase OCH1-like enzyme